MSDLKKDLQEIKATCTDLGTYIKLDRLIDSLPHMYVISDEDYEFLQDYKKLSPSMQVALQKIAKAWYDTYGTKKQPDTD